MDVISSQFEEPIVPLVKRGHPEPLEKILRRDATPTDEPQPISTRNRLRTPPLDARRVLSVRVLRARDREDVAAGGRIPGSPYPSLS